MTFDELEDEVRSLRKEKQDLLTDLFVAINGLELMCRDLKHSEKAETYQKLIIKLQNKNQQHFTEMLLGFITETL